LYESQAKTIYPDFAGMDKWAYGGRNVTPLGCIREEPNFFLPFNCFVLWLFFLFLAGHNAKNPNLLKFRLFTTEAPPTNSLKLKVQSRLVQSLSGFEPAS